MRPTVAFAYTLIALVAIVLDCTIVVAQTVIIPFTDRGWYDELGIHVPSSANYAVGDVRGDPCPCHADVRNFFVFDLAGVTQPIASAKLELYVPGPPFADGYKSGDPSENYELHDVTTSIAGLLAGTGGVAAHADLGTGVVYGSRTMTAADMGSVVEITLNSAAIAALNAATGLIGIGGSLTTLDAVANNEFTFGFSGINAGDVSQLRLTLVPEPSSLLLCLAGIFATLMRRKRTR